MNKPEDLIRYFNNTYGIKDEWPPTFEVSAELYGRCCQYVFYRSLPDIITIGEFQTSVIHVHIGAVRYGLMFKNVELVIKDE